MRFLTCAATALLAIASFFSAAANDEANVVRPRLQALLISLESYDAAALNYVEADLNNLLSALSRLGCNTKTIREETFADREKFKEEFEKAVVEWRDRLREDETAILYLAGHGVQDANGKFYIPMLNFKTTPEARRFQDAAVSYAWVREQLEKAECKNRVVFIDACHSGAVSRTLDAASPIREFVAPVARDGDVRSRITVLASSAPEQLSWLWESERSSLFTYWLVKGLLGYADQNDDFSINLEELKTYVGENVERVSKTPAEGMRLQTPVLHNESANASFAFPRLARKTDDAAKYCAEFLNRALKKLQTDLDVDELVVARPQTFLVGEEGSQADAIAYGTYPQTFVEKLTDELSKGDRGGFLNFLDLEDEELNDENALARLAETGALHAVVSGRVWRDNSGFLAARVSLTTYKQSSGKTLKSRKTSLEKIFVTKEDRALLGDAYVDPTPDALDDAETEAPRLVVGSEGAVSLEEYRENEELAEQVAENRNPIDDPNSPFKIQICVQNPQTERWEPRLGQTVDGKRYVPIDKGERFAVRLENQYPDADGCYVRLFLDGLNTCAFASADARSMVPEAAAPQGKNVDKELAPRVVDVKKATAWFLPKDQKSQIDGFVLMRRGVAQATKAPFLLEDYAPDSFVALRDVDGAQIGLVTAIFSVPKRTLSLSDYQPKFAEKNRDARGEIAAQIVPPSETYRYRWERRKADETEWKPVPGRTDKIYPLSLDDVGCFLRVVVQGQDAKLGEVSVETQAAVQKSRGTYSVAPDFSRKIVVDLKEVERLEDQDHTTFQIYRVSSEKFKELTEKN